MLTKLLERFEALPVFSKHEWEEAFKSWSRKRESKWGNWPNRCRVP